MEQISYQDLPPGMFKKLMVGEQFISESGTDYQPIKLRVSQINSCAYCIDMHYKELKSTDETELRLSSLSVWKHTPYFSNKGRATLQFAKKLTQLKKKIFTDCFTPILAHFHKTEISYLILAVTQINTWKKMIRIFKFKPSKYQVQQKQSQ